MKNKINEGNQVAVIAQQDISSGDVVLLGGVLGIAAADASIGQQVSLHLKGTFLLPKAADESIEFGQNVYWNGSQITAYNTGTLVGHSADDAAQGSESIAVFLNTRGAAQLGNTVFVASASDFPKAENGIILLEPDTAYFLNGSIDLQGNRLVAQGINTIFGSSSETSSLTSTGLDSDEYLIESEYTLALHDFLIFDVQKGIYIHSESGAALDWTAFNFRNIPESVLIEGCGNFVYSKGAAIESAGFVFDGTIATVAMEGCIFTYNSEGTILHAPATANITRRFRVIYSSFVCGEDAIGIDFNASATIPDEAYILDVINFSGAGTYLQGLDRTSNKTLFERCKGITNTSVNGQAYMRGNATPTPIGNTTDFFKLAGGTTPSPDNSKYLHSDNRLTNDAVVERTFLILATISFNSGNNNQCEFGFYDSKLGAVRLPSIKPCTANAAGRAENVMIHCIVNHKQGDFIEVWCRNASATTPITGTELNFSVTKI